MKKQWSLQRKFLILVSILITLIICMITLLYITFERHQIKELVGQQALTAAKTISELPEIKEVVAQNGDASKLQSLIENIRAELGAEFIVIGDKNEIRYTHPDPDKIGKAMVGGDNEPALKYGESYSSVAEGTLGVSVRGKTPIFDDENQIIGVVSVGFMVSYVDSLLRQGLLSFSLWLVLIFIVGIVGSYLLSRSIRKDTFGLEPYQIGRIYKEMGAILESVKEGLIATDQNGVITLMNQSAKEILQMNDNVVGLHVKDVLPQTEVANVLAEKDANGFYETTINKKIVLVSYKTIDDDGKYGGKVASFQVRSDLQELIHTLSEVQQYSQDLRAQTHEYTNKLYAISGWLQLGNVEKAKEFIHQEIGKQQTYEKVLFEQIADPTIQAVLIGKLSKASEKKVEFIIHEHSDVRYKWPNEVTNQFVTIIGNIIDNAFDAVVNVKNPKVEIFMTDMGNDLVVEVSDNGVGIKEEDYELILQQGFSTKEGKNRGYGLALVQAALSELDGALEFHSNEPKGTIFTIYIPKKGGEAS